MRVLVVAMKILPTTVMKDPTPFVMMNLLLLLSWRALAFTDEVQKLSPVRATCTKEFMFITWMNLLKQLRQHWVQQRQVLRTVFPETEALMWLSKELRILEKGQVKAITTDPRQIDPK